MDNKLASINWEREIRNKFPGLTIKRGPGAASKLTDEVIKSVCAYIREGLSIDDSCRLSDITAGCFHEWMEKGRAGMAGYVEFYDEVRCAQADFKLTALKDLKDKANRRDAWEAHAWLLERKFPAEFGRDSRQANDNVARALDVIAEMVKAKHEAELAKIDEPIIEAEAKEID